MAQTLPPAQPAYILRGHSSQIHATQFIRINSRLVTGDAEGWVVFWSLATKRPVAVWRAHEGSILGVSAWGKSKLITHGKDNKLIVWKFSEEDESSMSKVLPVDTPPDPRKQPWVLHILHVNTMNFCSFTQTPTPSGLEDEVAEELLIAVPNTMSSETVDIFELPSCKRIHTIPCNPSFKGGMIMALSIFYHPLTQNLTVVAGFESGHTSVSYLPDSSKPIWQKTYISQAHTQPILSLSLAPDKSFYLTSSADAIIAKHPVTVPPKWQNDNVEATIASAAGVPLKVLQTKHAGQQSLKIRNDGLVFATAGWDSRVRVYSTRGMKELAVLKWHKEGCYAVAFAEVPIVSEENDAGEESAGGVEKGKEAVKLIGAVTVKEERLRKAKLAHWLAAGSKDGKVSLWDIY